LERPERYIEPTRFDTMPSQPSLQAHRWTISPSPTVVLVERDAVVRLAQQSGKPSFADLDRQPAQIFTIKLQQVEGAENGGVVVAKRAEQLKDREPRLVTDDRLAVDQA
jgi:hypothetical protein